MRRPVRLLVAGLVLAGGLAPAAPALARDTIVEIPGRFFSPSRATVVTQDRVIWANSDILAHDVRSTNGTFDSGLLGRGARFTHTFSEPGDFPYFCSVHAFMSGVVTAVPATLAAPAAPVVTGQPVALTGRVPAGTGHVTIEVSTSAGPWEDTGHGAEPAADGTFAVSAPAAEGAAYRVRTAAGVSPAVSPRVIARVGVTIRVRRGHHGGRTRLLAIVDPPTRGHVITLQLWSPERFAWRRAGNVPVGRDGRAVLRVRGSLKRTARFLLSSKAGGPALAYSRVVALPTGRPARAPDADDGDEATTAPDQAAAGGGDTAPGAADDHGTH